MKKLFALLIIFFSSLLMSGCSRSKDLPYLLWSLSGDGNLFSYTAVKNGKGFINIISKDGTVLQKLEDAEASLGDVYFGSKNFYYKVHYPSQHRSLIRSCDKQTFICKDVYKTNGSVRCIFEIDEKLAFFHSKYVDMPGVDIKYGNYKIFIFPSDKFDPVQLDGEDFIPNICPGKSEKFIEFGAFAASDLLKERNKQFPLAIQEHRRADIEDGEYRLSQERIDINIDSSISYYNKNAT